MGRVHNFCVNISCGDIFITATHSHTDYLAAEEETSFEAKKSLEEKKPIFFFRQIIL